MWPSARYSVKITEISCTPKIIGPQNFAAKLNMMLGDRNHVRMKNGAIQTEPSIQSDTRQLTESLADHPEKLHAPTLRTNGQSTTCIKAGGVEA